MSGALVPSLPPPPSSTGRGSPVLAPIERWVLALLLCLGLLLRLVDARAPFDRQFDGFQGSFFAVSSINYERLGPDALAGYPVANIDPIPGDRKSYYAYANHPPLVPWLCWASLELFGSRGWSEAWREGRAPVGIEGPLRTPFLVCNLLAWLALYRLLRVCSGIRTAAYGAALFGLLPVAFLYAGLVNYENPSLAALLWMLVALAQVGTRPRALLLAALCAALAGGTTFAPAFFLPGIWLWLLHDRGLQGLRQALLVSLAMALPLLLHGFFGARALALVGEAPASLPARVHLLLAPLLDGSLPIADWLATQGRIAWNYFGPAACGLAVLGLLVALRRARRDGAARIALVLFVGGALVQLGFYRHTGDPQEPFLLNLAPGVAALAGLALARATARTPAAIPEETAAAAPAGAPEASRRAPAGTSAAAALLLAGLLGLPSAYALHQDWRGPERPLPAQTGAELADLLPPGSVAWYPQGLGFNNAVFFYAWRTLLPVSPATYGFAQEQARRYGMDKAPLFVVLPREAPAGARESVDQVAADLEAKWPGTLRAPDAETANYRAFRIAN